MKRLALTLSLLLLAAVVQAEMDIPSQGWDGVLNITANDTIDLSQAMTGTWDTQPSGYVPGRGIYDPEKWVVVFHYTSVTIASGTTLRFKNHPANPPVVWLVEGAVLINGTLNIRGQDTSYSFNGESAAGPGGFKGGRRAVWPVLGGCGFGPGGGGFGTGVNAYGYGGGYSTVGDGTGGGMQYGNEAILPLIGGSGGGGGNSSDTNNVTSGTGGGGAILIAAQASTTINGSIDARGGNTSGYRGGGGSGGAVRIITANISGTGTINATRGISLTNHGGHGRIRIEATIQGVGSLTITPLASIVDPGDTPQFWPDTTTPTVRVISLNGIAVPADPQAQLVYPWEDVFISGTGDVTAILEATNVPTNSAMQVFITKQGGQRTLLPTGSVTLVGGNSTLSTWQAVFPSVPNGMFAIQARADLP